MLAINMPCIDPNIAPSILLKPHLVCNKPNSPINMEFMIQDRNKRTTKIVAKQITWACGAGILKDVWRNPAGFSYRSAVTMKTRYADNKLKKVLSHPCLNPLKVKRIITPSMKRSNNIIVCFIQVASRTPFRPACGYAHGRSPAQLAFCSLLPA